MNAGHDPGVRCCHHRHPLCVDRATFWVGAAAAGTHLSAGLRSKVPTVRNVPVKSVYGHTNNILWHHGQRDRHLT